MSRTRRLLAYSFLLLLPFAGDLAAQQDSVLARADRESAALVERVARSVVGLRAGGRYGSGFAVEPGLVLTTTEVADQAHASLEVYLPDARLARGRLVASDHALHVALVALEGRTLPPVTWGDSERARVGEGVYTFGNPFGSIITTQQMATSYGTLSGRYAVQGDRHYEREVLETTAAVNQGSFGGPLVNVRGEVIGMVHHSVAYKRWLGVAIPARPLVEFLARHKAGRTTVQAPPDPEALPQAPTLVPAFLGVRAETVPVPHHDGRPVPMTRITAVAPGSPAAEAGLQAGDIVLAINRLPVRSHRALEHILGALRPGQRILIEIHRPGHPGRIQKTIVLASRPL